MQVAKERYLVYRSVLARTEPERKLYLAITQSVFCELLSEPLGQIIRADYQVYLIIFADRFGSDSGILERRILEKKEENLCHQVRSLP
ncbi:MULTISPECIES: element excision factor XisH family protein [Kamptonema]|uniref:element excision factor XisH family protein n=1 Tax=Kamptonema TaxID=1501433 RepID=UPI0002F6E8B7|nr:MULTISPECIES: element excision factor XisH family protein [Kamptonema]